jgi:hypothetical protein
VHTLTISSRSFALDKKFQQPFSPEVTCLTTHAISFQTSYNINLRSALTVLSAQSLRPQLVFIFSLQTRMFASPPKQETNCAEEYQPGDYTPNSDPRFSPRRETTAIRRLRSREAVIADFWCRT